MNKFNEVSNMIQGYASLRGVDMDSQFDAEGFVYFSFTYKNNHYGTKLRKDSFERTPLPTMVINLQKNIDRLVDETDKNNMSDEEILERFRYFADAFEQSHNVKADIGFDRYEKYIIYSVSTEHFKPNLFHTLFIDLDKIRTREQQDPFLEDMRKIAIYFERKELLYEAEQWFVKGDN